MTFLALSVAATNIRAEKGRFKRVRMPDPATDRDAFLNWQRQARGKLLKMLGIPGKRDPLHAEARGRLEADGVIVEKWVLTLEPGSKAPAVLYRPKQAPPAETACYLAWPFSPRRGRKRSSP